MAPRACVRAAPAAADLMHAEGEAARGGTRKARPPRHAARALELVKPAHLAPGGRGIAQVAAHIMLYCARPGPAARGTPPRGYAAASEADRAQTQR